MQKSLPVDVLAIMLAGVSPPALPAATGFGVDLACTNDLDPNGRTVSGQRVVAEAVYRRLTTRRGSVIDDPNYGYDLTELINDESTQEEVARTVASAQAECLKDERVITASIQHTFLGGILTMAIQLTTAAGPFQLVLAVDEVTVKILRAPA